MMSRIFYVASWLVFCFSLSTFPAKVFSASLVQDTEIEDALRTFASPIFKIAGLKASSVEIYIVNDDSLNAFVTGGQKLFMNSGLLLRSENANQIIGVIAHETGHISGGHLSRVRGAFSKSTTSAILGTILGGAAAIATGRGDLGAAIVAGGQSVAQRNFLAYSRTQEGAADHAALSFLDKTKQSARGLLAFMQILEDQELLSFARQDPYVRSHPLSRERITTIENHVENSAFSDAEDSPQIKRMFARMRAKLFAYLRPYGHTLRRYPDSNQSVAARYARAIAEFRRSKLDKAIAIMDVLIHEDTGDPYFHEMKGQMLYENGRIQEAIEAYGKAAAILPQAPYIRRDLARAQIDSGDQNYLKQAIANLEVALATSSHSARNWRFLAIAHGRSGNLPKSYLALGEEALLLGKPDEARFQANRAKKAFARGTRDWLQAEDILIAADEVARALKRNKKNK